MRLRDKVAHEMDQPTLRTFIVATAVVSVFLLLSFLGFGYALLRGGFTFSEEVGAAFNAFVISALSLAATAGGIGLRAMLKRNTDLTEHVANGQRDEIARLHAENKELVARVARLELLLEQREEPS